MKLILCKNRSIGSLFLRTMMWSKWSHSAIYDDDLEIVYDSAFLQGGVKEHNYSDWIKKYSAREERPLIIFDVPEARKWLKNQLGKKYDFTALFSIVFIRTNWQKDDKWFCSEMCEAFRNLFSIPVFRADAYRVTPQHQDIVI